MLLIPPLYHRMRAINGRRGRDSFRSDGTWELLRGLQLDGPRTLPQMAWARRVARQRIQKIVDEPYAADLVLFRDNSDHN